jgi:hypothetical protein
LIHTPDTVASVVKGRGKLDWKEIGLHIDVSLKSMAVEWCDRKSSRLDVIGFIGKF